MADISKIKVGETEYNLKDSSSYKKPSEGIPASDLTSTVQSQLTRTNDIKDSASVDTCMSIINELI